MQAKIDKIKEMTTHIPEDAKPKVFIEIWSHPLMTAGRGSFVDELITLAGGINISKDTLRPYSYFSAEEVIKRNPDYIILAYMEPENPNKTVSGRIGWNKITAVTKNQVYNDINPDLFLRPGPRLVEGLKMFYEKLHPQHDKQNNQK